MKINKFSELSDAAIMELNLPTGIPFVYELDENLKPVDSMVFLGDEETVKKAMAAVAAQGKAKQKLKIKESKACKIYLLGVDQLLTYKIFNIPLLSQRTN